MLDEDALNITRPQDYGFDTFQLGLFFSGATIEDVDDKLVEPDDFFEPNVDFVLTLSLEGETITGTAAVGSINREDFHDNPDHDFYTDWGTLFQAVHNNNSYRSRFKGIRWNHELQPWRFHLGSAWETYADEHCAAAWAAIQADDDLAWMGWLNALALGQIGEHAAYTGSVPAPWNGSTYQHCQGRPLQARPL